MKRVYLNIIVIPPIEPIKVSDSATVLLLHIFEYKTHHSFIIVLQLLMKKGARRVVVPFLMYSTIAEG